MEKLKFDFDEMVRLASDNPTEFTRRREALIHQVMATSPQSANLIDLQMDVDAERYGLTPGIRSSERIQNLMAAKIDLMGRYLDIYMGLLMAEAE